MRPVTIRASLQRRRLNVSLDEALESGPMKPIGEFEAPAGSWQEFHFDIDTPRISTRSVRFVFEVENPAQTGDEAEVLLDDMAWIEWRTPWEPTGAQADAHLATHVQAASAP